MIHGGFAAFGAMTNGPGQTPQNKPSPRANGLARIPPGLSLKVPERARLPLNKVLHQMCARLKNLGLSTIKKIMDFKKHALVLCLAASQIAGCGGGSDDDNGAQQVVARTETLAEGTQLSYTLAAGTYNANITASNNGVIVSWPGGNNCATSAETRAYSGTCTLSAQAQIVILNPTTFGLGGSEITTISITKN
jgi:hypothetical protein